MKFLSILVLTAFTFTSCATHKYRCNYSQAKPQQTYRSTGYVDIIDSNLCVIRLTDKVVVRDDLYLVRCNYVVVNGDFAKSMFKFNNQVIKFEFNKNSEIYEDVIWSSSGCIEAIVNNERFTSIKK